MAQMIEKILEQDSKYSVNAFKSRKSTEQNLTIFPLKIIENTRRDLRQYYSSLITSRSIDYRTIVEGVQGACICFFFVFVFFQ